MRSHQFVDNAQLCFSVTAKLDVGLWRPLDPRSKEVTEMDESR